MQAEIALTARSGSQARNTHASAIDEAEADLRGAVEQLKRGAECSHPLTKNLAMSFACVSIENALLTLALARESAPASTTCRRCTQSFATVDDGAEYAEGCEDPDCPMRDTVIA